MDRLLDEVGQAGYSVSYGIEVQKSQFDPEEIVKKADAKMIEFKKEYYKQADRNRRV